MNWQWKNIPKIKKVSSNYLKNKLDRLFSEYIRLRDTRNGYGRCITCDKVIVYNNCDCGHFISRNKITTRWDERNANAQCKKCNRFLSGKQYEHGRAINNKFGEGIAEILLNTSKLGRVNQKQLIEYYQLKIKEIKNESN